MTKINIATQLNKVFTAAVRAYLAAEPAVVDPRRYGSAGRDAIAPEVARLLGVIGAAAAGVLGRREPVSRYRRWNELLELLATAGQLQVEDAAKALNVSAATIRRDFDELAGQQMLTRIRGGAVAEGVNYDLPLRYKTERHPSEKHRIGALAAGMVRTGQAVGLNGGTTTTEVARALATRPDLGEAGTAPALTVVTNALNIATELAIRPHIKIVTTGGVARPQSYELTGPLATGVLEQVTLDIAFLGVDAIDAVAGATAHHEGEASINRLMGRQARKVVIVADSSKVGQRAFARICTPAEIDVLVTDAGIAAEDAALLEVAGVDVVTAYRPGCPGRLQPGRAGPRADVTPPSASRKSWSTASRWSSGVRPDHRGGRGAARAARRAGRRGRRRPGRPVHAGPAGHVGVDVGPVVVSDDMPTGMTVALSRGGDRAIFTALGAVASLTAADVPESLLAGAPRARQLLVPAAGLARAGPGPLFAAARAAGATTSLDTNWDPAERWTGETCPPRSPRPTCCCPTRPKRCG